MDDMVVDAKDALDSLDRPCDADVTETIIMGLPWRLGHSTTWQVAAPGIVVTVKRDLHSGII